MTPQELETSLKKGKIPTLCYLFGEESFLIDRAVIHPLKILTLMFFTAQNPKG